MSDHLASIRTITELCSYVHSELCEKEQLLIEQFETVCHKLYREGKIWGAQFTLQGPRNICLQAVWSQPQNVLAFYDSRGQRYQKLTLPTRPRDEE